MDVGKFFYRLGRRSAPQLLKAKWLFTSVTGDTDGGIEAEHDLGWFLSQDYLNDHMVDDDEQLQLKLDRIGKRLKRKVRNPAFKFHFTCTLSEEENACALPGGYLFISHALLELCDFKDNAIAFILAHEMGHVVKRHSFNRFMKTEASKLLKNTTTLGRGHLVKIFSGLASTLYEKGYSREQEFEADRFAVRLCEAAGFDPDGGIDVFNRLRWRLKDDPSALGKYFSTHPPLRERAEQLIRIKRPATPPKEKA